MRIQTVIPDDELMDDCISLTYYLDFGELHERDKYCWVEAVNTSQDDNDDFSFKKTMHIDFEFKMNHIKQILKLEIVAQFKQGKNLFDHKSICKFSIFLDRV